MRAWRRHAQRWLTIFSKWWLKQQRRRRRRERQAEAEEEETFWASSSNLPRELFYSICEECSCCCCCVNRTNSSIDPVQNIETIWNSIGRLQNVVRAVSETETKRGKWWASDYDPAHSESRLCDTYIFDDFTYTRLYTKAHTRILILVSFTAAYGWIMCGAEKLVWLVFFSLFSSSLHIQLPSSSKAICGFLHVCFGFFFFVILFVSCILFAGNLNPFGRVLLLAVGRCENCKIY